MTTFLTWADSEAGNNCAAIGVWLAIMAYWVHAILVITGL